MWARRSGPGSGTTSAWIRPPRCASSSTTSSATRWLCRRRWRMGRRSLEHFAVDAVEANHEARHRPRYLPAHPVRHQRGRDPHRLRDVGRRATAGQGGQLAHPSRLRLGEPGVDALARRALRPPPTGPIRRAGLRALRLGRQDHLRGVGGRPRSRRRHSGDRAVPASRDLPGRRGRHRLCGAPPGAGRPTHPVGCLRPGPAGAGHHPGRGGRGLAPDEPGPDRLGYR